MSIQWNHSIVEAHDFLTEWSAIEQARLLASYDFNELDFDESFNRFVHKPASPEPPPRVKFRVPSPARQGRRIWRRLWRRAEWTWATCSWTTDFSFCRWVSARADPPGIGSRHTFQRFDVWLIWPSSTSTRSSSCTSNLLDAVYAAILLAWQDWPGFEIVLCSTTWTSASTTTRANFCDPFTASIEDARNFGGPWKADTPWASDSSWPSPSDWVQSHASA